MLLLFVDPWISCRTFIISLCVFSFLSLSPTRMKLFPRLRSLSAIPLSSRRRKTCPTCPSLTSKHCPSFRCQTRAALVGLYRFLWRNVKRWVNFIGKNSPLFSYNVIDYNPIRFATLYLWKVLSVRRSIRPSVRAVCLYPNVRDDFVLKNGEFG